MSNMSYCRFRNTLNDLRDCRDHIDAPLKDGGWDSEKQARLDLIDVCREILDLVHITVGDETPTIDEKEEN